MKVVSTGGGFNEGDIILACDDKSITTLLEDTVFKFRGSGITPRENAAAPWLFTQHGNPFVDAPISCQVVGDDSARRLEWSSIDSSGWRSGAPGQQKWGGQFEYINHNDVAWIKLPSFNNRVATQLQALYSQVESDLDKLRTAPLVILDVRGNGGGNSQWGVKFSQLIWSPQYVEAYRRSSASSVEWRVSEDNAAHVESFGRLNLAQTMRASIPDGGALLRQDIPQRQPSRDIDAPLTGNVIVLMDSACVSACLDFLDLLSSFEGISFVGEETSADTNYIEVRRTFLPGYRFRAVIPIKVYRDRIRPDGGSYSPTIHFPNDLDRGSDKAVLDWLRTIN
ncbi:S41 family peptidase [Umboniibacter marinipuniceus]|uniref:S41 family peptidase n=1 Tax=Umboniibacter marinipuniceus TaxID=569599 RepID=UPI000EF8BCB3|nr:S41 family peptidase [Umboniibacter marinipuniceus]